MLLYLLDNGLIFLLGPRSFYKFRVKNFLPSVQTLYFCSIREKLCYSLPIFTLENSNCLAQCFILFRCPATLSSSYRATCSPAGGAGIGGAGHQRRRPRVPAAIAPSLGSRRTRQRQMLPALGAAVPPLHLDRRHPHLPPPPRHPRRRRGSPQIGVGGIGRIE